MQRKTNSLLVQIVLELLGRGNGWGWYTDDFCSISELDEDAAPPTHLLHNL